MPAIWISTGNRHLALNLLGRAARPLRDDLDVIVGDVRIGFNREGTEGDNAPCGEDNVRRQARASGSGEQNRQSLESRVGPRAMRPSNGWGPLRK
jgi:hypothetical protein